ncbi:hypothetical protein [Streptomyces sp. NPDC048650]|uniref:hypothetical protein n=1 Tax=unclassified Streptomyces TaxID=2593676 RepID=UPI00371B0BF1
MEQPTSGPEPEAAVGETDAEPGTSGEPERAGAGETEGADRSRTPAGPQPLGVEVTPTGDAAVDARLRRLADADHLPASGHLEVYEDVHRGLRDALAALDQRPGPPAPSPTYDNRS